MDYGTDQIRNIALAGHPGAGKTQLFEALLHAGGAINAAGTIERGSTVSDFDPLEKERGHSIDAAIASTDHKGIHVNLVDTPGYPDFRGAALAAIAAVDTVAVVVDADAGTARMAVAQPVGSPAIELGRFHVKAAGRVGPFALQMHNEGLFDEYANIAIEENPAGETLITMAH